MSDGFHEEYKLNMEFSKHGYRIAYKWWLLHVYKKYDDGREHHLGEFASVKQTREFILSDIKKGTESEGEDEEE